MNAPEHGVPPPAGEQEAGLRVSDRERERAVDLLSQHAAQGRLTPEELEARIDSAHAARTRGQLAVLTADLPAIDRGDHPDGTRGRRVARGAQLDLSGQLVAFFAVNLVLVAVWALSGMGYFWPAWPLLGWGLALLKPGPCGRRRAPRRLAPGTSARRLTRPTGGSV